MLMLFCRSSDIVLSTSAFTTVEGSVTEKLKKCVGATSPPKRPKSPWQPPAPLDLTEPVQSAVTILCDVRRWTDITIDVAPDAKWEYVGQHLREMGLVLPWSRSCPHSRAEIEAAFSKPVPLISITQSTHPARVTHLVDKESRKTELTLVRAALSEPTLNETTDTLGERFKFLSLASRHGWFGGDNGGTRQMKRRGFTPFVWDRPHDGFRCQSTTPGGKMHLWKKPWNTSMWNLFQFRSCLFEMSHVMKSVAPVPAAEMQQSLWTLGGTSSLFSTLVINDWSTDFHRDWGDKGFCCITNFGPPTWFYLPELGVRLWVQHGDMVCFNSAEFWHASEPLRGAEPVTPIALAPIAVAPVAGCETRTAVEQSMAEQRRRAEADSKHFIRRHTVVAYLEHTMFGERQWDADDRQFAWLSQPFQEWESLHSAMLAALPETQSRRHLPPASCDRGVGGGGGDGGAAAASDTDGNTASKKRHKNHLKRLKRKEKKHRNASPC